MTKRRICICCALLLTGVALWAMRLGVTADERHPNMIRLCQAPPTARFHSHPFGHHPGHADWSATAEPYPTAAAEAYGPGEYSMPGRTAHVPSYRIRVGDRLAFIFRRKRDVALTPYQLNVGDTIRVESLTEEQLDRQIVIQPDGFITLPPFKQIGQVRAAGRTIQELTEDLEERYKQLYVMPSITVTPVNIETRLQDLLASVDARFGAGGLREAVIVTPEGTVQLPGIGSVHIHGMTVQEVQAEVEARYEQIVVGLGVDAQVTQPAGRSIYVAGEVVNPNRYEINTPTTVSMAIWMAGGWKHGGKIREVVVFRRTEDWGLIATKLDLRGVLLGRDPCPADEIWLRDSDIVLVPRSGIMRSNNFLDLIFTQGLYRVIPIQGFSYSASSTL